MGGSQVWAGSGAHVPQPPGLSEMGPRVVTEALGRKSCCPSTVKLVPTSLILLDKACHTTKPSVMGAGKYALPLLGGPQGHVAGGADEERHEVSGGSGWIAGSSCFLPARPGGDCSSHGLLLTDLTQELSHEPRCQQMDLQ